MILIDALARSQKSFDACLQLAEGLAARGHKVVLDENSAPADFDRSRKFSAAGFLADLADLTLEQVILLGGDEIADERWQGCASSILPPQFRSRLSGALPIIRPVSVRAPKSPMPWGENRRWWIWPICSHAP
jgi:hypothetical protein